MMEYLEFLTPFFLFFLGFLTPIFFFFLGFLISRLFINKEKKVKDVDTEPISKTNSELKEMSSLLDDCVENLNKIPKEGIGFLKIQRK